MVRTLRRSRLVVVIGVLAYAATALGASTTFQPNVLVIVSDDQGSLDASFQPFGRLPTPNIDSLAAEGAVVRRFYTQPWCQPTRASLLTGARLEEWAFAPADVSNGIPRGTPTIARRFQDAGYQTALVGKWHLGGAADSHPNNQGFDHFYGHLSGVIDYVTHRAGFSVDWQRNGKTLIEPGYSTNLMGAEMRRWIRRRDPSKPFFAVLSFNAPHGGLNVSTAEMRTRYCAGKVTFPYACKYWAAVQEMDLEIGRVLATLDDERLADDTLVVFFSDNGGSPQFGHYNVFPLRGGKGQTLEGGIRMWALFRWPGRIQPRDVHRPMHVQDLWATLEGTAGLDRLAPPEGVDHWKLLRRGGSGGRGSGKKKPLFFSNRASPCPTCCCVTWFRPFDRQAAVIRGRWKLHLRETVVRREGGEVVLDDREVALYDVVEAPGEQVDLSEEEPRRTERMLRELLDQERQP